MAMFKKNERKLLALIFDHWNGQGVNNLDLLFKETLTISSLKMLQKCKLL